MGICKYEFGETPAEVVGEAPFTDCLLRREWIADRIDSLTPEQMDAFERRTDGFVIQALNFADLLTLLDALATQSFAGADAEHGQVDGPSIAAYRKASPAGKLRINILAALGIEES